MGEGELVVATDALTKSYGGVDAVKALRLEVPRHSIFGFLGPNGAGKTTTMKMLLGLIRPSGGTGSIFGLDIVRDSPEIRARIGYLPQDPRFYEHMSARETLRFAAGFFFSGPAAGIDARVERMLALVGLEDKADRPIKSFSGGERQRLGIAQAQIHEPELLILDEPAAALDPLGRRDVLAILEGFRETSTVFYSTHILDDVQRVSDTVCILNKGEIAAQGSIGDVLAGGDEIAYAVEVRGDVGRARAALLAQAWVTEVSVAARGDAATLRVTVTDPEPADAHMQRVLLEDESLVVTQFRRETTDLERIFIDLVEGGHDG
ncbi:ABC transporter ATP-binding protein [Demequina pelophila]|uniref:ABC transporter ATP-binding protein n=1 Tax=Demequina pelophila TaxID=1638984 RepID=UPI000780E0A2|nr:ABC transporter ATP-binding protein [Demequina pelophila]